MPEGDSIAKLAAHLRPHLVGREVRMLRLRERGDVPSLVGSRIDAIDTVGKNLLIRISPDWVIRVHLGMHGRFRWYGAPDPARHARSTASVVISTDDCMAVCRDAMRAELRKSRDPRLEQLLKKLGPDLLAPECDLDRVVARARAGEHRDRPIADVLIDQRVAAGVGNVYKSEVAFTVGVHPTTTVAELPDETLHALFSKAQEMMLANVGPGMRTTTVLRAAGRRRPASVSLHWVYRRHGLPCHRCRTPIERMLLGVGARSTYWCPKCQPRKDAPAAPLASYDEP